MGEVVREGRGRGEGLFRKKEQRNAVARHAHTQPSAVWLSTATETPADSNISMAHENGRRWEKRTNT